MEDAIIGVGDGPARTSRTTEISGRMVILIMLALAVVFGLGGSWYRVSMTDDCAELWGAEGSQLVAGESQVELLVLEKRDDEDASDEVSEKEGTTLAGFAIKQRHDLTSQPGMVHFRNALTLDRNFDFTTLKTEAVGATDWKYALRFFEGQREIVMLATGDFSVVGRVLAESGEVERVDSGMFRKMATTYLKDIGVLP